VDVAGARRALAALALSAALLSGCSDSHLVTGSFRSAESVVVAGLSGTAEGVWVELVLGQYGPDVAGIIRFYDDPDFILPVEGLCPCRFLVDGRFDSPVLVFAFPNPSPGCATKDELLAGRLEASPDGDTLVGRLGRSLEEGEVYTFRRNLSAGDLGFKEKECRDDPLDSGSDDGAVGDVPDVGDDVPEAGGEAG